LVRWQRASSEAALTAETAARIEATTVKRMVVKNSEVEWG